VIKMSGSSIQPDFGSVSTPGSTEEIIHTYNLLKNGTSVGIMNKEYKNNTHP